MAVGPGAPFRNDNGFIKEIGNTDFVMADQPVTGRNGEYAGFISDKTRRQRDINMFRWTHKDHIQPPGDKPGNKTVRFIFRNMDIRIRILPDEKVQ